MDRDDLNRVALWAVLLGLAGGLAFADLGRASAGTCFALAALWGSANFWVMGRILADLLGLDRHPARAMKWVFVKPLLFFGGAALIVMSPVFSVVPFLAGFHVVIALAVAHVAVKFRSRPLEGTL